MKKIWENQVRTYLHQRAMYLRYMQEKTLQNLRRTDEAYNQAIVSLEKLTVEEVRKQLNLENGVLSNSLSSSENSRLKYIAEIKALEEARKETFTLKKGKINKYFVSYFDSLDQSEQILELFLKDVKENIGLKKDTEIKESKKDDNSFYKQNLRQHPFYEYFSVVNKKYRQKNLLNWELSQHDFLLRAWQSEARLFEVFKNVKISTDKKIEIHQILTYYLKNVLDYANNNNIADRNTDNKRLVKKDEKRPTYSKQERTKTLKSQALFRPNLYLQGQVGSGKTYTASALAYEFMQAGYFTLMLSIKDVLERMDVAFTLRKSFANQFLEERLNNAEDALYDLLNADVLVIDDLGSQSLSDERTLEYLLYLLDYHSKHRKITIITSNVEIIEWQTLLDERFFSRLFGNFNYLNLTSADLRYQIFGKDKRYD